MSDFYEQLRKDMVIKQLKERRNFSAAVLECFLKVPRHLFVLPEMQALAYADTPLPIGYQQTISQPYIVALMTEAAKLQKNSLVLEIGTGSGYQAAILGQLAGKVYTIERLEELYKRAKSTFAALGYHNIEPLCADGTLGLKEKGPFDAILVTASAPKVPEALIEQLAPNGRLIIPVGDHSFQQLLAITRNESGEIFQELIENVRFVPLIGEQGWQNLSP